MCWLLRLLGAFVLSIVFVLIIGLQRRECHLDTWLVCLSILVLLVVYIGVLNHKNRYSVTEDALLIEEYFIGHRIVRISLSFSLIEMCTIVGWYGNSIKLVVHGREYILRNVSCADELVRMINKRMED